MRPRLCVCVRDVEGEREWGSVRHSTIKEKKRKSPHLTEANTNRMRVEEQKTQRSNLTGGCVSKKRGVGCTRHAC